MMNILYFKYNVMNTRSLYYYRETIYSEFYYSDKKKIDGTEWNVVF